MSFLFTGTTPCNNCPYRKDAPLRLWDKKEFEQLLKSEAELLGKVYGCHKNNGTVCKGWLINQDKRRFPSVMLRLYMIKAKVDRSYLDKLDSNVELFDTLEEMCYTNFPELQCAKKE